MQTKSIISTSSIGLNCWKLYVPSVSSEIVRTTYLDLGWTGDRCSIIRTVWQRVLLSLSTYRIALTHPNIKDCRLKVASSQKFENVPSIAALLVSTLVIFTLSADGSAPSNTETCALTGVASSSQQCLRLEPTKVISI
ncbi:hypothetical protein O9993_17905 [Vibrio lentus]|nr:hypothetical protein [Vibrio lentus]